MLAGLAGLTGGIVARRENSAPSQGDLVGRPLLGDVRPIAEHEMEMVAHHGIATDLDGEEPRQLTQPIKNPLFAVSIVLPGVRVDATEEGPTDASGDGVSNADHFFSVDLAPGVGRHQ